MTDPVFHKTDIKLRPPISQGPTRHFQCPDCDRWLPVDEVTECDKCGAWLELRVKVRTSGQDV